VNDGDACAPEILDGDECFHPPPPSSRQVKVNIISVTKGRLGGEVLRSGKYWRYFVVEMQDDTPDTVAMHGHFFGVMSHKEQLLEVLTFRHMIKGWVKIDGKIIICLTRKVSLPNLRASLHTFRKHYPECDVTEVMCEGSVRQMLYYH